jgi:uncharacterized flavoprotein (TIGR03862 family)
MPGRPRALVFGTGPAGLMAATVLARGGIRVILCEKQKGAGRKLLIAGGSGLNISSALPNPEFVSGFEGCEIDWTSLFAQYSVADWLAFVESLGLKTFKGTSARYFVEELKATNLLKRWLTLLEDNSVEIRLGCEARSFRRGSDRGIQVHLAGGEELHGDAVVFALGGASWLPEGESPAWAQMFHSAGISLRPFTAANCGFDVKWKDEFLGEVMRRPLKNIVLYTPRGHRKGDVMITEFGIEGSPVYAVGEVGVAYLDLKPDLTEKAIVQRLASAGENLSPLRRAGRFLKLDPVRKALLFHHAPAGGLTTIASLAQTLKKFPLELTASRPLSEAISSRGGIALSEIDDKFMLKKTPGVFVAGEMLDWHAPTGGFLIQASVSQGVFAAEGVLRFLRRTA